MDACHVKFQQKLIYCYYYCMLIAIKVSKFDRLLGALVLNFVSMNYLVTFVSSQQYSVKFEETRAYEDQLFLLTHIFHDENVSRTNSRYTRVRLMLADLSMSSYRYTYLFWYFLIIIRRMFYEEKYELLEIRKQQVRIRYDK